MKNIYLLLLLVVFNCATPYQKDSFRGGYSETKLDSNMFRVNFDGNGYTNSQRTVDFVLLRSAEVALENGFKYFIITDSSASNSYSSYSTPKTTNTTGTFNAYGNHGSFHTNSYTAGGNTYTISKPSATNLIICFKNKPKTNIISYNAQFISDSIREKYDLY